MKFAPLILLALAVLPAKAPVNLKRLSMQWEDHQSIHLADEQGAINRRAFSRIDLELFASGELKGSDTGRQAEHNLYKTYSTNDETTWTNAWNGTWAISGNTLKLQLALTARNCQRTQTTGGNASISKCEATVSSIEVACASKKIEIEEPSGDPIRKHRIEAWHCDLQTAGTLAGTPSLWIFGKTSCLKIIGGSFGDNRYQKCAP